MEEQKFLGEHTEKED